MLICGLVPSVTGCALIDHFAGAAGGRIGMDLARAVSTPPADVKSQVKGGDVCDVLPKLGWPARLPQTTITTIDGQTLRVVLDTNDTVKACPK